MTATRTEATRNGEQVACGWFKIDNAAIPMIRQIGVVAWAVYCILKRHAGAEQTCWPSTPRIAGLARCSERAVRKAIKTLVKHNMVAVERQSGKSGVSLPNLYRLLPVAPPDDRRNEAPGQAERNDRGRGNETTGEGERIDGVRVNQAPGEEDSIEEYSLKKTQGKKTQRGCAAMVEIPKGLDTPEFQEAWAAWLAHRKEIRKPAGEIAQRRALMHLVAIGPARAVAAINHSVGNGWIGIFEPKESHNGKHTIPNGPGQRHAGTKFAPGEF